MCFVQCGWWHEIESWCEADDEFAVCIGYNWPEMDQCILGPGLIQLKHHTAYPILTQGEVDTASHECLQCLSIAKQTTVGDCAIQSAKSDAEFSNLGRASATADLLMASCEHSSQEFAYSYQCHVGSEGHHENEFNRHVKALVIL